MNDEKIKLYFLGKLTEPEAENFEFETAADENLTEQAQAFEEALIDDYRRGSLTADEKRLFETNYLISESRRGKLKDAQLLSRVIEEERLSQTPKIIIETTPKISIWATLFANRAVLAFGALLLVCIAGGIVLILINSKNKNEIAEIKTNETNVLMPQNIEQNAPISARQNPNGKNSGQDSNLTDAGVRNAEKNNPAAQSSPKPEIKAIPKTTVPAISGLASFILTPGSLRSEGEQVVKIASPNGKAAFSLNLPPNAPPFQKYRAVLQNAEGEKIEEYTDLKSPKIIIPAAKLENRTYIIFLEGQNKERENEQLAEYTFRVEAKKK